MSIVVIARFLMPFMRLLLIGKFSAGLFAWGTWTCISLLDLARKFKGPWAIEKLLSV